MAPSPIPPGHGQPARAETAEAGEAGAGEVAGAPIDSAAPPVGARVLAFVAILVGGTCGALIGYAVADLQCVGDCDTAKGLGATAGALVAAAGVAVVVVLVLRAMGEWRTIQHRQPTPPRR